METPRKQAIRPFWIPFQALFVLLKTPRLWITIFFPLFSILTAGLVSSVVIFLTLLGPQARYIQSLFNPSYTLIIISWIVSLLLVICESGAAIVILSLFLISSEVKVFDTVLQEKCPSLYLPQSPNDMPIIATQLSSLRMGLLGIVTLISTLPLNAVPILGQFMFVFINGWTQGPLSHTRYFDLKGWDQSRRESFIRQHRWLYWQFGISKTILEMIPIVNCLGVYVNSIGAALLAHELEQLEDNLVNQSS